MKKEDKILAVVVLLFFIGGLVFGAGLSIFKIEITISESVSISAVSLVGILMIVFSLLIAGLVFRRNNDQESNNTPG